MTKGKMDKYVYQLVTRLDGIYYCRICQVGIHDALATTDDYDEQEDATLEVETLIQGYLVETDYANR